MSKFTENAAAIRRYGGAAAQTLISTPLKQAAALWIVADLAIGYVGATPQTGPANEFLIGYGTACTLANGLMFTFGDGRKVEADKVKNPVLRTLNAYGEHTANYLQFGGQIAFLLSGLLPGGFHEISQVLKDFTLNVSAITRPDVGLLATGVCAVAGGTLQAFGKDSAQPRRLRELPRAFWRREWHELKKIAKGQSPYKAASYAYHGSNVALLGTGIAYLASGQHSLTNALMVICAPILYTLGNIQLGRSAKAKLNDAPTLAM